MLRNSKKTERSGPRMRNNPKRERPTVGLLIKQDRVREEKKEEKYYPNTK